MFWIGITFLATTIFKNSNAFEAIKMYVDDNNELKQKIGQVEYYGFLIGGSISSSGDADISFSIIGQNETVKANAILENGKVIDLKYK